MSNTTQLGAEALESTHALSDQVTAVDAPAEKEEMAVTVTVSEMEEDKKKPVVKERKARTPRDKKPKPPTHPPYFQMIKEAITSLNEKGGSSPYAIAKFMEQNHKAVLPANFRKILGPQLKNSVVKGKLIKIKGSFKLSDVAKKKTTTTKTRAAIANAGDKSKEGSKKRKPKSREVSKIDDPEPQTLPSFPTRGRRSKRSAMGGKPKQLKSIKSPVGKKAKKISNTFGLWSGTRAVCSDVAVGGIWSTWPVLYMFSSLFVQILSHPKLEIQGARKAKHISAQVFRHERPSDVAAKARRADANVWREWTYEMEICQGTANYVAQMGFGVFFKLGNLRNDHSLLHALLERFRPETYTFHLPVGEAMISLQDVEVLLGLRVDGYLVGSNHTGLVVPDTDWESYVQGMLGLEDLPHGSSYFEAEWLVTSHLETRIRRPATLTEADMQQRARCFVLWMLGNGLFINSKKTHVHMDMVMCVSDFDVCSGYSWGSAVLAYLLHDMCKCVLQPPSATIYMNGATQLLQYWAYERISILRPQFRVQNDVATGMPVIGGPLGSRYTDRRCIQRKVNLPYYRDQLATFSWEQFEWTPYRNIVHSLPHACRSGWEIYLSTVPLICGLWVAFHNPHRCIRQFGGVQTVPVGGLVLTENNWKIHVTNKFLTRKSVDKWRNEVLLEYINLWNERHQRIFYTGPIDPSRVPEVDPCYLTWYLNNSVRYICDPDVRTISGYNPHGERLLYTNQCLTDLRQRAQGWSDQSLAHEVGAYLGSVAKSPWVDPPATVPPTQVMRSPPAADAEQQLPPVRQRRHPRTRDEALATQEAYNAQYQHQHQQDEVVPQYQAQQGGFMGLDDLDLDALNWEQISGFIGGDNWGGGVIVGDGGSVGNWGGGNTGGVGGSGGVVYGRDGGSGGNWGGGNTGGVGGSGGVIYGGWGVLPTWVVDMMEL
ncbi:hypothetical protein KSS87_002736 [Heliosperma pusillum]|nr:hypothetical protein KSS87_002736 [Heliosperma pusillum]